MSRRVVNIAQACELADVSRRTVYNWMRAGKVEYLRTAGGSVRIYVDTLFTPPTTEPPAPPPFPQGPLIPPADRARLGVETPTKGHPK
jgi:excisionase family DNA binding protein